MTRDAFLEHSFPDLLDKLYDAALDPTLWPQFLDALRSPFGDARGLLHIYDPAINAAPLFLSFGTEPEFLRSYQEHYAPLNPYPIASFETLRPGQVNFSRHIVDEEQIAKSEFYNDWMKPQGACLNHLGVVLHRDAHGMAVLAISPNDKRYAANSNKYARRLALLVPHLMRAVKLNQETYAARISRRLFDAASEAVGLPVFLLSDRGRLVEANPPAEECLRTAHLLSVDAAGNIRAARASEDAALQQALGMATGPLRLRAATSSQTTLVWVVPVNNEETPPKPLATALSGRHVILLLSSATEAHGYPPEVLMSVFNLTFAEAKLAGALVSGLTLADYAEKVGLSRNTVRNQLAQILHKTGTKRQADLVALIARTLRWMPNLD